MNQYSSPETSGGGGFLNHLPVILWQRRWFVLVPLVVLSIAGIAAAILMPTVYRSAAVLLVEAQELPKEVVGSPVTSTIDERIARIRQKVLSRGDLISLIQQNGLYERERRSKPLSVLVEDMRDNTKIDPLGPDVGRQQNAGPIAFSMSFDYSDPVKAQLVMQSFVDSFLELDSTDQAEQATSMVDFLSRQTAELQKQIADLEGRITSIKAQNGAALASAGIPTIANPGSYDSQIAALQRDNLTAIREARPAVKDPVVAAAEAQLAAARAIYTDGHPDVVFAKQRLEEARRLAAGNRGDDGRSLVAAQIAANNAQIAALGRARAEENARRNSASATQARAPVIMEQVAQLENRAAVLRAQYQDASSRLLNARNSAQMEQEDKGERLTVVDPPAVPDKPVSPNRPLLIGAGIAAGILGGVLLAMLVELVLRPIRGVGQIEKLLGVGPLVVVPTLKVGAARGARASKTRPPSTGKKTRARNELERNDAADLANHG